MGRPSFKNNDKNIRAELNDLETEALTKERDRAHDALYGEGAFNSDIEQDSEWLEELAIQDRAILRIADEILKNRTQADFTDDLSL